MCQGADGIGPVYAVSLYLKRGHRLRIFLQSLSEGPTPIVAWAKTVGRETMRTGGMILTDIAENKSPELSTKNIVSKYVTESVQKLIGNLRFGGRIRAIGVTSVTKKRKKAKYARVIKRDIS